LGGLRRRRVRVRVPRPRAGRQGGSVRCGRSRRRARRLGAERDRERHRLRARQGHTARPARRLSLVLWIAQSSFPISGEGAFGGAILVGVIAFLQFWVIPRLLEAKQEIIDLQAARIEVLTKRADDLTEAVKSQTA